MLNNVYSIPVKIADFFNIFKYMYLKKKNYFLELFTAYGDVSTGVCEVFHCNKR